MNIIHACTLYDFQLLRVYTVFLHIKYETMTKWNSTTGTKEKKKMIKRIEKQIIEIPLAASAADKEGTQNLVVSSFCILIHTNTQSPQLVNACYSHRTFNCRFYQKQIKSDNRWDREKKEPKPCICRVWKTYTASVSRGNEVTTEWNKNFHCCENIWKPKSWIGDENQVIRFFNIREWRDPKKLISICKWKGFRA